MPEPSIRELTLVDLPRLLKLGLDRGWSPEEHKWRLLLSVGTGYGIAEPDGGGLAGAYVLTRYGADLATIGMVLVARRFSRQGLGRRMMRHALDQADGVPATLHATDNGRPLYEQLGFTVISAAPMRAGVFTPDPEMDRGLVRPAVHAYLGAIRRLDREACGADRSSALARLPSFCDRLVVAEVGGQPVGFAGAWPNVSNSVVGPVIADDDDTWKQLISALAEGVVGEIRTDVDVRHEAVCRWLDDQGITDGGPRNYVMIHGAKDAPGDIARRFAPITVAM